MHTQVMLILINGQYLQIVVFSFEKGLNDQKHSSSDSHQSMKQSHCPQQNLSFLPLQYPPLTVIFYFFTLWKESVFGVILVRIFPAFSRIWTEYGEISISPYSARMQENAGKMLTRITSNTDSFYSVSHSTPSVALFEKHWTIW